ncbi:MAG: rhomboid family intramembrane serine protease [Marinibacterium sp.]|nr:rhomboid family intramembrane serine protease [Marinibacterium sp.]
MSDDTHESPVNPLPPVVAALFLVLMGIEAMFSLGQYGLIGGPGAVGWRLDALQTYGFSADVLNWMRDTGRYPAEHMIRFVSYPFVHATFTQALFSGVLLLAMGKMTAEVFGSLAMLVVFFGAAIGGALSYALLTQDPTWLIGAFPAVYGLIGAYTFILWRSYERVGANKARAFTLIALLMGVQLLFGLLFGGPPTWVADLGGFACGFGLSFLLAPGGLAGLLRGVRRD